MPARDHFLHHHFRSIAQEERSFFLDGPGKENDRGQNEDHEGVDH
jgi:hypothetical protein